ncbi:MAG: NAD(P)-binding protein [Anaerolineae bacterium]|nr:NAD(P)-binding protein [Anaerolineae bacterium]
MHEPIIIIGAGVGGLSAAIQLAAAGRNVRILEQGPTVGGKMGEVALDGFRWDTGPSVITMRWVLRSCSALQA